MVTGSYKPYILNKINQANLDYSTLSIRIFTNGLSISIHKENSIIYSYTVLNNSEKSVIDNLKDIWNKNSFLNANFKNVFLYIDSFYSTWIPEEFYVSKEQSFTTILFPFEEESMNIHADFHPKLKAYHLYTLNKKIEEYIKINIRSNFTVVNDIHNLMDKSLEQKSIQNKVFLNSYQNILHIWCLNGNTLSFHKNFLIEENNSEIAFYILTILEKNNIDLINDLFYILGSIPKEIENLILKYIPQYIKPKGYKFPDTEIKKIEDTELVVRLF